ncbi:NTP transferase domain-containing protein [Candidatus Bathycorpusculum sp.]|uniref:NTP transferase domain-containing protein n=1 Tax=Candidatus Bathycorpusculum sp. TaxID=2994959 RepID=UPI002834ADC3|nr:NTP transferase domain-containing protein [Candidatus Termitimicrobium sp.]MCL2686337.1 NTP transferase domain-containing protein [Candidatus Termitimicrobium sp.]
MSIPALIMAGGKGSRMGLPTEKPMLPFLGKPLIDWVIDAVLASQKISEFYVITSSNTPKTEQHCQNMNWKIVHTNAKGYHDDLKQAITKLGWNGPVLTMPSDVPAITGEILDRIILEFEGCCKDFLAVFVPIEKRQQLGLSISSTDEYQGVWYAVSGINIINGTKILGEGKTETAAIITQETEVTLNINTTKDLEIAKQLINKGKNNKS